jgi:hypothetical protein
MGSNGMTRTSVVFIREIDQQMTGSNCCGKLEGENACQGGEYVFPERRQVMEKMGSLYRMIKQRYKDEVELEVVDPRNHVYLIPRLVKDIFRYRVPFSEGLKTLFSFSIPSIVINGRLAFVKEIPAPEALKEKIESLQ